MTSVVRSVRARSEEWSLWSAVAARLGVTLNAWARRALNDQAELDLALLREAEAAAAEGRFE